MGVSSCRFLSHAIQFIWQYGHSRPSIFVVYALAPIWHQDICNHCDHGARTVYIKSVEYNIWHLRDTMARLHYTMAHSVLSWWSINHIKLSVIPRVYIYIYTYISIYVYLNAHICTAHARFHRQFAFVLYSCHWLSKLIYRRLVLFGVMCGQVRWEGPCTEYVSFNHVPRLQVPGPERCCACRRWRSYCGRLEAQYAGILEMASLVYRQFKFPAGM